MDIFIPAPLTDAPRKLIRRAGYAEFRDPNTGEFSYVRRLQPGVFYPRFHVYLKDRDNGLVVSLHLDQKKPSYGVGHAHSGEYDGVVVEREGERVKQTILAVRAPEPEKPVKRGFFSRIFGGK
ncbi:hypothetical protein EPN90_03955 [Patescibacteria group bacterium]|nr:MAG: hypothetical protein EPN90_03955 [Patescibacteria group bacterium]